MTKLRLRQVLLFGLLGTLALSQRVNAGAGTTTAPTNTVTKILAAPGQRGAAAWTTNTAYAQGQVVQASNDGLYYMCVVAGTSTNNAALYPTGHKDYSEGTCTWRPVLNRTRKTLVVSNDGTNVAYLVDFVGDSGDRKGIRLNANGGSFTMMAPGNDVSQSDLYIFCVGGTTISHFER